MKINCFFITCSLLLAKVSSYIYFSQITSVACVLVYRKNEFCDFRLRVSDLSPLRGQTVCNEIKLDEFFEENKQLTRCERKLLTLLSNRP